ncbi:MAG TPA: glycosyltransferase family 4 protein [Devosiaceae bacterium]|jgi:Fuc2NAc and GlcNAc transferase|nr:glycosyltransferase family 4 protein [Devosiaceae bacterium]
MLIAGLLTTALSAFAAYAVTALIRRHAETLGLVATPNARSSHTVPTPSGGGVGIVAGGVVGSLLVLASEPWPGGLLLAAALLIAAIGFIDDRRPLPAIARLGAQVLLVGVVAAFALPEGGLAAQLRLPLPPMLVTGVAVLAAVYWINLFNFMDGIDGLAASQAIYMLLTAALLALLRTEVAAADPVFWWLPTLAAACAGFLLMNWPPARIFMGDAGSTYLGFLIAVLALTTVSLGWLTLWQWLILAALFAVDATVTLCRRLLLGERVFEAHRRHAYQRLARRWHSHRRVTLAAIGVNVLWLLPLALLAGWYADFSPVIALVAYLPLVALALGAGAGAPEPRTG